MARPLVSWSGGKTYRLPFIEQLLAQVHCSQLSYVDPMVGGGAPFWAFGDRFRTRAIGDKSCDLVTLYRVVKESPEALIKMLTEDRFYYISSKDCISEMNYRVIQLSTPTEPLESAARTYFLLRAAINGLWRVNSVGQHNAAPGYKVGRDIVILDRQRIWDCHWALTNTIVFRGDVLAVLSRMDGKSNVLLFIDPPYHSDDGKAFTNFSGEFGEAQQRQLVMLLLASRHRFIYLNRATEFVRRLWAGSGLPQRVMPLKHSVGPAAVRARVDHELIVWRL
jgi:DNA adenine methylase